MKTTLCFMTVVLYSILFLTCQWKGCVAHISTCIVLNTTPTGKKYIWKSPIWDNLFLLTCPIGICLNKNKLRHNLKILKVVLSAGSVQKYLLIIHTSKHKNSVKAMHCYANIITNQAMIKQSVYRS